MAGRSLLSRPLDLLFFVYFVLHIPIALLIDGQAVIPTSLVPDFAKEALKGYIEMSNDTYFANPPPPTWFQTIVLCELLIQMPFFFAAAYKIWADRLGDIRISSAAYAAHVSTTVITIFGGFVGATDMTTAQKQFCISIYSPWLIIPLLYLWRVSYGFDEVLDVGVDKAKSKGIKGKNKSE